MFSVIRKRFTYANVVLTLALVFAMSGGAYAANRYLITSTKQIGPKVLKSLKGVNGKNGETGPAGPAGSPGPAGPAGAKGEAGTNGTNGTDGKNGTNGKDGTNGKEGSPWTAGGTLPSEKTEFGVWSDTGNKENETQVYVPISFTLPLAGEPLGEEFVAEGQTGTHCAGTAAAPTAPPGYLCVYDVLEINESLLHVKFKDFLNPQGFKETGVSPQGTLLELETVDIGEGTPFSLASGTWAVTAE